MAYQVLHRGDQGENVVRLQSLLNRVGAMLDPDGDFGRMTDVGARYAQDIAQHPITGIADSALWTWLETRAEPFPRLDTNGVAFIAREETGGLEYYSEKTQWPIFPGEKSGITIGVGYDLRWNSQTDFNLTWGKLLPSIALVELGKDIGKKGTEKRTKELRVLGIIIPFKFAWEVFIEKSLPRYYESAKSIYSSLDDLPALCRSVLVSIVFNRGTDLAGDRRREMKEIQNILAAADQIGDAKDKKKSILAGVEDQIVSMKRLWKPSSGLIKRRQSEANLWRQGLLNW